MFDISLEFPEIILSDIIRLFQKSSRKVSMTTPTPHDSFFKDVFGPGKANILALFALLDAPFFSRIDPASLTYLSGEMIGEGLATSYRSDLVGSFLVADAKVDGEPLEFVFLFEHKSFSDRNIPFKLACLVAALWARFLREGKTPLPVVPILIHHGERPWSQPVRLSEILGLRPELAVGMPDYALHVIDLTRLDDQEIRRKVAEPVSRVSLAAMKHTHDPLPSFLKVVAEFLEELGENRDILMSIGTSVIDYAVQVHPEVSPQEMLSLLTTVTQENETMYTVIDLLRDQGIERGIEQGIERGRQEGRKESIEKLLLKGAHSPEEIASILDVDLAWVQGIARSVAERKHP